VAGAATVVSSSKFREKRHLENTPICIVSNRVVPGHSHRLS
jgi:hypothetical protein